MITARTVERWSGDPRRERVALVFSDDSGAGILGVRVWDAGRVPVAVEQPPPGSCPPDWVVTVEAPASRFPLAAAAMDCAERTTPPEVLGPLAGPPDVMIPGSMPCDSDAVFCPPPSPGCLDALDSLERARTRLRPGCTRCGHLSEAADSLDREVEALGIAWTVVSILALMAFTQLPWPANVILGAVLSAAAIIILGFLVAAVADALRARDASNACWSGLAALFDAHDAAAGLVALHCCGCHSVSVEPPCRPRWAVRPPVTRLP